MARRKIDKQALASLIRESKELSNDQKSDLLQLLNEQKRYGLVWESHKEDAEELLEENIPVLVEDDSKRILSPSLSREGRGGSPNHILIEGDNLHALTALTYTHEGKVDVIYIDPPYNTGNKDFVYNDSYVDSEDGYRHSKWLSFMEKRLRIAKKLLSDRGVIFISIDDNEQANLKLLCDEVFGESHFIGTFKWNRVAKAPSLSYSIRTKYEYVLMYNFAESVKLYGKQSYNTMAPLWHLPNKQAELHFAKGSVLIPKSFEKGIYSEKYKVELLDSILCKDGVNENSFRIKACSAWSQNKIDDYVKSGNQFVVKKNISTFYTQMNPENSYIAPSDLISMEECGVKRNTDANEAMKELGIEFNYSKPVSLIQYLINIVLHEEKDSLILDFFAGSGTTLHATMQLNAEDGGHRQCILVTNNENNICEEVTYERNKRVINGYTTPKGVDVPGLTNNNLRYYKTAFVPREKTAANRHALMNMSTDLLCIKENMYNEQPFEIEGKKMKPEFVRYFVSDAQDMIIIYDPRAVAFVAKALPQDSQKKIMVYVYSDGQYAYNDEFHGKNIELCALPDAIYQALSRVLPPMKEVEMNIEQEGTL